MAKLLEPDLTTRMLRITTAFNDVLYAAANEPSLGMYRLQEHVNVTVPRLVEQQRQLTESCQRVEGACYDLEYDTRTLKDMAGIKQFKSIQSKLLQAIELKKKLDETHQTIPPSTSLPSPTSTHHISPHTTPISPASLPHTFTKTSTPTREAINKESNKDSTTCTVSVDDKTHDQEPVLDLGIRPKTFD